MAQYVFIKFRDPAASGSALSRLESICEMLTPHSLQGRCNHIVAEWPGSSGGYYAIQNSDSVTDQAAGQLTIGWVASDEDEEASIERHSVQADGSYAVIQANTQEVSFFTDQFGSRTLWYYMDDEMLVVSTSQRAIVRFKGAFAPNQAATGWFLSSGCQGPFAAWDEKIVQVKPGLEYVLDVSQWQIDARPKPGIALPQSGKESSQNYLDQFESQVIDTIKKIVGSHEAGEVLLPLSGGLDSRLLLALSREAGVASNVELVNWGIEQRDTVFDDKRAAQRIADTYRKPLLDRFLPTQGGDYDDVLDRFVEASEGRIDHFNAYTDGFSMWDEFYRSGFRCALRGDIPFPTAIYADQLSARQQLGFATFEDYANTRHFSALFDQRSASLDVALLPGETLVQWRDRLYASYRIPMVVSAFTDLVSGHVENYSPMMSWSLFKAYVALPDHAKGDKKHIRTLWRKHDHSGVPSHAEGSLASPVSFFQNTTGRRFMNDYLTTLRQSQRFPTPVLDMASAPSEENDQQTPTRSAKLLRTGRSWVSRHLPRSLKAYLKAKRPYRLSPQTLAYRLVLVDKILNMYEADAKQGAVQRPNAQETAHLAQGKS
ncbi:MULTISPECIES: hypothetical protein [unclassified Halomonas]|uniref:hypothetical protein n=1 Tax=unclassified Halomonas TaxID=2609666 RepID=UPI0021E4628D|nr:MULTISPECIES: hypothetical protein [unclassified Halomonas]UYF99271.1 hypothetical protein OCT39_13690 [Halomonas sp. GD1P12]WNL42929.1 hypothetical protein RN347_03280 [Halomonas sp. PAMB 3264]